MRKLWLAATVSIPAAMLGGWVIVQHNKVVLDQSTELDEAYRAILALTATAPSPEKAQIAAFFPKQAVARVVEGIQGASFPLIVKKHVIGIGHLDRTEFEWHTGRLRVTAHVSAGLSGEHDGPLNLNVTADLMAVGTALDPGGRHDVVDVLFDPIVLSIKPSLSSPIADVAVGSHLGEIIGEGVTPAIAKILRTAFPVPAVFDVTDKINAYLTSFGSMPTAAGGSVSLKVAALPFDDLVAVFDFKPMVTDQGLWVVGGAKLVPGPPKHCAPPSPGGIANDVDAKSVCTGGAVVTLPASAPISGSSNKETINSDFAEAKRALAPYRNGSDQGTVFISKDLPAALITEVQAAVVRPTVIQSYARSGNLAASGGKFSYEVELVDPQSATVTVALKSGSTSWNYQSSTASIKESMAAHADVKARLHVHFPGGSWGPSVGIDGDAAPTVTATASVREAASLSARGLLLVPDIPCQMVRLRLVSDGHLVMNPIHLDVPQFGLKADKALATDQLKPIVLADTVPHVVPAPGRLAAFNRKGYRVTMSNLEENATAAGLRLSGSIDVEQASEADWNASSERNKQEAELVDTLKQKLQTSRPACKADFMEADLGPITIGNNSVVAQVGRAAIEVTKAPVNVAKHAWHAVTHCCHR